MMKKSVFAVCAFVGCSVFAEAEWTGGLPVQYMGSGEDRLAYVTVTNAKGKAVKRFEPGSVQRRLYEYNGGMVIRANSGTGSVVVVNAQHKFPSKDIGDFLHGISTRFRLNMELREGAQDDAALERCATAAKDSKANAIVYVVDVQGAPSGLVAYDSHWGTVNVHALFEGVPNSIGIDRTKKSLLRTLILVCGGADSVATGTLMWPVNGASDLDTLKIPPRVAPPLAQAVGRHMVRTGMWPVEVKTYRQACEAGWAHSPTNDVERKIWNDIHALPTNPLPLVKPAK